MNSEIAKKAAKWWANQLRGDTKLVAKLDNPLAEGLAYMLQDAEKSKITSDMIDRFEKELTNAIMENKYIHTIGVDYHPDGVLQDAAEKAGLPLGMTTLPWKTVMWIDDEKVRVSCGYGAPVEELK